MHYLYDPLNRLIEASFDKKRIRFSYDPLGRRLSKSVWKQSSSGWTESYREFYLYDGMQELGTVASDGTLKNLRVVGLKEKHPVAIEINRRVFAPILDGQGSVRRLLNPSSKAIVSRYEYSAFGEERSGQNDQNPWRFAAMRFEPELKLIYFGDRDYDPECGRWLTPPSHTFSGPADQIECLNLYPYAFNNPFKT
jgi:RHS repeat-associated protein